MRRLLVLGLFACLVSGAARAAPDPVVRTAAGPVRGEVRDGISTFLGVPYAAAPVGPLRWRPPAPVSPWKEVRPARAFGAPCAQIAMAWNQAAAAESREDCLYLNVWVPPHASGAPLPVMLFFPGGAYHGGSARGLTAIEPSYDGSRLAARGVVVVSANYRLGPFGFLAHPELTAESPDYASGDYALMDQIAVLQWIQANIAQFGGDAGNVTMMGQSAGGYSVAVLMTSPKARGLFHKAVMFSGNALDSPPSIPDLKTAEAAGAAFVKGLGAASISDLRQWPAEKLLAVMAADPALKRAEPRDPVVEGVILPEQPGLVFQAGREAKTPLLIGATARDGDFSAMGVSGTPAAEAAIANLSRPLAEAQTPPAPDDKVASQVAKYYGPYPDLAAEAARIYADPSLTRAVDGDPVVAQTTDDVFRCGATLTARWHARVAPTWRYEVSHGYAPLGATHIWDLIYLFGWRQPPADQPRDARLVDAVQAYWTSFARSGAPAAEGLPVWPRSQDVPPAQAAYLDLGSEGPVARLGPRAAACDLYARRVEHELSALASQVK